MLKISQSLNRDVSSLWINFFPTGCQHPVLAVMIAQQVDIEPVL